jgi:thymidylate synthase ThyX
MTLEVSNATPARQEMEKTAGQDGTQPGISVYAVYGVEPEIQAYAMAKYSRSSLTMKESLEEISQQKAEKFLNTFYFQYGHRSIADLAHIAMAVERLSILAAIVLADEQRWDGQERSTRYQDFRKSGYYTPDFGGDEAARNLYGKTVDSLFEAYQSLSERMFRYLAGITPRPEEMKVEAYERTLRARAFDIARYLLPLATNTSLGQIVNARTLENQVARLLSHPHAEVRRLGELLKQAALSPSYDVNRQAMAELVEEIRTVSSSLAERAEEKLLREVRVAPTLVKYADPNAYEMETRRDLKLAAAELMKGTAIRPAETVTLLDPEPLEIELASTLLYEHCHYSYCQIREAVEASGEKFRAEIVDLGLRHRGKHDEVSRPFSAGQQFRFDILMDIGAFRDLHRHRRCVQIGQEFTTLHGYDTPEEVTAAGAADSYHAILRSTAAAVEAVSRGSGSEAQPNSQYAIPLAFRKRTLFKMDLAEALYISELRTGPAGHFSYRNVAYAMYEAVAKKYPSLGKYFRVHNVHEPVDLLKR